MRTLLLCQTSIVFKGHKKLSVILNNHIKWCKKWCRKIPFPCFCSEISDILNVPLNSEGHISCFGKETSSKFDQVFHGNANHVPYPDPTKFPQILLKSFSMYKKAAVSFCHDFKENLASPLISCQIPNMFHEDLNTLFAHINPPSNIFLKQFTSSTTLMFSMQNLNHIPFCLLSN